jgi:hypothetical protein
MSSITLRDVLRGVGAGAQSYGGYMVDKSQRDQAYSERESNLARQMAQQRYLQEDAQAQQLAYLGRQDELMRGREQEQRAFDYPEVPTQMNLGAAGMGNFRLPNVGMSVKDLEGSRVPRSWLEVMMYPKPVEVWDKANDPVYQREHALRSDFPDQFGRSTRGAGSTDTTGPEWIPWDVNGDGTIATGELGNIWAITQGGGNPYGKPGSETTPQLSVLDQIRALEILRGGSGEKGLMDKDQMNVLDGAGKLDIAMGEYIALVSKGLSPPSAWAEISAKYLIPATGWGPFKGSPSLKAQLVAPTQPTLNAQMTAPAVVDTSYALPDWAR